MQKKKAQPLWMALAKAALVGVLASLALILLCALAMQKEWLQLANLTGVSVGIKVVSACAASFAAVRLYRPRAWLTGGLAGLCYAALAFLIFSLASETYAFSWGVLADLLTGFLAGAFCALLTRTLA